MNNKSKQTSNKSASKYKTTNGIQVLPSGSYRVRKMIDGKTYSATFTKRKDAINYRDRFTA